MHILSQLWLPALHLRGQQQQPIGHNDGDDGDDISNDAGLCIYFVASAHEHANHRWTE